MEIGDWSLEHGGGAGGREKIGSWREGENREITEEHMGGARPA
jgi:hypothetical protein